MPGLNCNLLDQLAFYGAYHNNKWNQVGQGWGLDGRGCMPQLTPVTFYDCCCCS